MIKIHLIAIQPVWTSSRKEHQGVKKVSPSREERMRIEMVSALETRPPRQGRNTRDGGRGAGAGARGRVAANPKIRSEELEDDREKQNQLENCRTITPYILSVILNEYIPDNEEDAGCNVV